MQSRQIRQQFLEYFRSKAHALVPSSPVVPFDDPTLMFTNAGMNQFKPLFLGTADPRSEFGKLKRAANTQKCIRAGGKHNDLDDVGQDTYHHTFFEMLGNWSFGDYFKKEAISWAWELLTGVWGIDKSRLHATYFQGDAHDGLEPDREAAELWRTMTDIDPTHIHPGNKKDNFWEMGDTGPCGPCSEIHIDLTPDKSGARLVNKGDARVMEIWNLVFIQFNRGSDGKLSPLPARHVDTGMGFERLCAVLQGMERGKLGKVSNYDTDVFTPIFDAIRKRTGAAAYAGTLPSEPQASACADAPGQARRHEGTKARSGGNGGIPHSSQVMVDVSYRVIADHIRCLTFALTDGAIPSNEGRGYVLRRILRRAVRYGRQYLHMHEPFLCDLVQPLVAHMGDFFPELRVGPVPATPRDNVKYIAEMIRDEEASFLRTLDRGMRLFSEAAEYAERHHHGKIRGEDAFKLHDTYGFPIDLTELMAEERGVTIDIGEYERLMEEARVIARSGGSVLADVPLFISGTFNTKDSCKYTVSQLSDAKVLGFVDDRDSYDQWSSGSVPSTKLGIVLDKTCAYAEQGGQVGDSGVITTQTGIFEFTTTERTETYIVHVGLLKSGRIVAEQQASIRLNKTRFPTMQNHTSTHILNWALREVLGSHVQQKGSLVDPEKTRFDFSHPKALTEEEIEKIERLCNRQVEDHRTVHTAEVNQKEALKINTLRAVFGEKYPDVVRVVSVGAPITEENAKQAGASDWLMKSPTDPKWMQYSVEFCGGTHLKNSREAERIVITEEEAVAKGVRRIVAVSGEAAKRAFQLGEELLREAIELGEWESDASVESSRRLKPAAREDLPQKVAEFQQRLGESALPLLVRHEIQARIAELQKVVKQQEKAAAADAGSAVMDRVGELLAGALEVKGVKVVVGEVPTAPVDSLRGAVDWVRQKTAASAVVLGFADEGKVTLLAGMSKDVVDRGVKAGDVIKEIAPLVGGKGGGRPDMAQGGGTDAGGLARALERARELISQKLA